MKHCIIKKVDKSFSAKIFCRKRGQAVNKTSNCVVLTHKPSGIQVKCHATRMLHENRKEARRLLITKLDNLCNGVDSVEAQEKRIFEKKNAEANRRRRKTNEMKQRWREKI